jgi:hypothetical protein
MFLASSISPRLQRSWLLATVAGLLVAAIFIICERAFALRTPRCWQPELAETS